MTTLQQKIAQIPNTTKTALDVDVGLVTLHMLVVKGAMPGEIIWIQAAEHGDELDGIAAIWQLYRQLDPAVIKGVLVLLPIANPTAFASGHNRSPKDNVNLNRVFSPTATGDTYSYQYGRQLAETISATANYFIDLHGGGEYLAVTSFATISVQSTPAVIDLTTHYLEVQAVLTGDKQSNGMLIDELTRRGLPALLLESGGASQVQPEAVATHVHNVVHCLQYWHFLSRSAVKQLQSARILEQIQEGYFDDLGLLVDWVTPGHSVALGETVVAYQTLTGQQRQLTAKFAGLVLSVHDQTLVRPNQYAFLLGK